MKKCMLLFVTTTLSLLLSLELAMADSRRQSIEETAKPWRSSSSKKNMSYVEDADMETSLSVDPLTVSLINGVGSVTVGTGNKDNKALPGCPPNTQFSSCLSAKKPQSTQQICSDFTRGGCH